MYTSFNIATAFSSSLPTCSGTSIAYTPHTTLPLHFPSSLLTCSGASIVCTPHTTLPLHIVLSHSACSGTSVACITDVTVPLYCVSYVSTCVGSVVSTAVGFMLVHRLVLLYVYQLLTDKLLKFLYHWLLRDISVLNPTCSVAATTQ